MSSKSNKEVKIEQTIASNDNGIDLVLSPKNRRVILNISRTYSAIPEPMTLAYEAEDGIKALLESIYNRYPDVTFRIFDKFSYYSHKKTIQWQLGESYGYTLDPSMIVYLNNYIETESNNILKKKDDADVKEALIRKLEKRAASLFFDTTSYLESSISRYVCHRDNFSGDRVILVYPDDANVPFNNKDIIMFSKFIEGKKNKKDKQPYKSVFIDKNYADELIESLLNFLKQKRNTELLQGEEPLLYKDTFFLTDSLLEPIEKDDNTITYRATISDLISAVYEGVEKLGTIKTMTTILNSKFSIHSMPNDVVDIPTIGIKCFIPVLSNKSSNVYDVKKVVGSSVTELQIASINCSDGKRCINSERIYYVLKDMEFKRIKGFTYGTSDESDPTVSDVEDAISMVNNTDGDALLFDFMDQLIDAGVSSEQLQNLSNDSKNYLGSLVDINYEEGNIPIASPQVAKEISNLTQGNLEITNFMHNLNRVDTYARVKAIENITDILDSSLTDIAKVKQSVENGTQGSNSLADDITLLEQSINSSIYELDDLTEHSNTEALIAHYRKDFPKFSASFDDFELSVAIWIRKIRQWILNTGEVDNEVESILNKVEKLNISGATINMQSILVNATIAVLGTIKKLSADAMLAVTTALATIDDIKDYFSRIRIPTSPNKFIGNFIISQSILVTASPHLSYNTLNYDASIKNYMFLPDYSGVRFGRNSLQIRDLNGNLIDSIKNNPYFEVLDSIKYSNDPFPSSARHYAFTSNTGQDLNSSLQPGLLIEIKREHPDLMEFWKRVRKLSKKFPYLGYCMFILGAETNFYPEFSSVEKGVMAATTLAQTTIAMATAALKTPGLFSKLFAAAAAAAIVASVNAVASVNWDQQFKKKAPRTLITSGDFPKNDFISNKENAVIWIIPVEKFVFHNWTQLKWLAETAKLAGKLLLAFTGSVAIGAAVGKMSNFIVRRSRFRKAYKSYTKPILTPMCENPNDETTCMKNPDGTIRMKKEKNPKTYINVDGKRIPLTRSQLKEKVAFDTFLDRKSSGKKVRLQRDAVGKSKSNLEKEVEKISIELKELKDKSSKQQKDLVNKLLTLGVSVSSISTIVDTLQKNNNSKLLKSLLTRQSIISRRFGFGNLPEDSDE